MHDADTPSRQHAAKLPPRPRGIPPRARHTIRALHQANHRCAHRTRGGIPSWSPRPKVRDEVSASPCAPPPTCVTAPLVASPPGGKLKNTPPPPDPNAATSAHSLPRPRAGCRTAMSRAPCRKNEFPESAVQAEAAASKPPPKEMGRPRPTRSHAPPKEMGRPRPTRSQPPRSARHLTNGPRAGHLPALPRTCDALVPHDQRLPQGRGTPPSHTITCSPKEMGRPRPTRSQPPRSARYETNGPRAGHLPALPKDVGRPRPTRSQPPRSARHLTNGPRAGHLPASPRKWDAPVPHDHSHRAPLAAKFSLRPRDVGLFSTVQKFTDQPQS